MIAISLLLSKKNCKWFKKGEGGCMGQMINSMASISQKLGGQTQSNPQPIPI